MILRYATDADFDTVVQMVLEFAGTTKYETTPDPGKVSEVVKICMDREKHLLLVLEDEGTIKGFLAAMTMEFLLTRETIATEIGWYASGEGHRLLEAFEYWARLMKAKRIIMSSLGTPVVNRFLRRQGYTMTEQTFVKELS